MDGARLFNAATALGVPVAHVTQHVDSVTFCLSKVMVLQLYHYYSGALACTMLVQQSTMGRNKYYYYYYIIIQQLMSEAEQDMKN